MITSHLKSKKIISFPTKLIETMQRGLGRLVGQTKRKVGVMLYPPRFYYIYVVILNLLLNRKKY